MRYGDDYRIGGWNVRLSIQVLTNRSGVHPAPKKPRSSIVTELEELEVTDLATIEEAVALIDKGLGGLTERQLVSASEVADLLLDVRSLLSVSATAG